MLKIQSISLRIQYPCEKPERSPYGQNTTHAETSQTSKGPMMNKNVSGVLATLFILFGCSGNPPENLGGRRGALEPCPDTPNFVSTKSRVPRHAMQPLPFKGTVNESRDRILGIIGRMKGATIVDASDDCIRVQFKTRVWGFVDDVEFFFDEDTHVIHFRSASRVGYYDFGQNRRRMKKISKVYLQE